MSIYHIHIPYTHEYVYMYNIHVPINTGADGFRREEECMLPHAVRNSGSPRETGRAHEMMHRARSPTVGAQAHELENL